MTIPGPATIPPPHYKVWFAYVCCGCICRPPPSVQSQRKILERSRLIQVVSVTENGRNGVIKQADADDAVMTPLVVAVADVVLLSCLRHLQRRVK